uniref:F-box domain-containing protein n=1 Tax=Parascaris univalens TaxID=6257 RepID=A0A915A860_PARUN
RHHSERCALRDFISLCRGAFSCVFSIRRCRRPSYGSSLISDTLVTNRRCSRVRAKFA